MYQPEEEGDGYLDPECGKISTSIMDGLKHGTEWLVVDETFICQTGGRQQCLLGMLPTPAIWLPF